MNTEKIKTFSSGMFVGIVILGFLTGHIKVEIKK